MSNDQRESKKYIHLIRKLFRREISAQELKSLNEWYDNKNNDFQPELDQDSLNSNRKKSLEIIEKKILSSE